jgi:hypothetical protein
MSPALPFAPKLVALIEARIRVDDVAPEAAARALTDVTNQIAATMAAAPVPLNAGTAQRAAEAADTLRAGITEWFSFYNGYDPLFTWWMGLPYKHVGQALVDYAAFLRDKVADPAVAANVAGVPAIAAAAAPAIASVPDLNEVLALPQDEMRDIVDRFNAQGGRGGRGGRGGAGQAGERDNTAWLAALTSLDFDALSRNAQVDYLFIKWRAETDLAHAGQVIPPGPPFRPDASGIQGKPRGREGLISDIVVYTVRADVVYVVRPRRTTAPVNSDVGRKRAPRDPAFVL